MKTPSHIRMFIIVTMIAAACTEQEIAPTIKGPVTPSNQSSSREYHTAVTTWSRIGGNSFVGLVSSLPNIDLSKAAITIVENGNTTGIDPYFDSSKLTLAQAASDSYIWSSTQNNILLLHFIGHGPMSSPPSSLEVIIVY